MRRSFFVFYTGLALFLLGSCGQQGTMKGVKEAENRIIQQEDGTVSLKLDKAECYSDPGSPANNTADWNVVILKPGRFKVWLTSATKDTSDLSYSNSVRISFLDNQLVVHPACDKIVHNSGDVPSSYFRADSYMGSFYVSEPGEYNIQVISEKVIARNSGSQNSSTADDTKLMSVVLMPILR
jgi:hypothetical protein